MNKEEMIDEIYAKFPQLNPGTISNIYVLPPEEAKRNQLLFTLVKVSSRSYIIAKYSSRAYLLDSARENPLEYEAITVNMRRDKAVQLLKLLMDLRKGE